jgi:hypothetical protein
MVMNGHAKANANAVSNAKPRMALLLQSFGAWSSLEPPHGENPGRGAVRSTAKPANTGRQALREQLQPEPQDATNTPSRPQ